MGLDIKGVRRSSSDYAGLNIKIRTIKMTEYRDFY